MLLTQPFLLVMLEPDSCNVFNLNDSFEIVKSSYFEVVTFYLSLPTEHFALLSELVLLENLLVQFFKLFLLYVVELHFL